MIVSRWWDLVTRAIIIFRKIRTSTTIATTDVVEMVRRQCEVVKEGPCTASINKNRSGQPQSGDPTYDNCVTVALRSTYWHW
jgi:hypothetical protein